MLIALVIELLYHTMQEFRLVVNLLNAEFVSETRLIVWKCAIGCFCYFQARMIFLYDGICSGMLINK